MLSQAQRTTILELNAKQVSKREIARVMGHRRIAWRCAKFCDRTPPRCRNYTESRRPNPTANRSWSFSTGARGISCESMRSWWRAARGLRVPSFRAFSRRHRIGYAPPTPAGQYAFAPGEEVQHDTSPHELELGGKKRKVQTASAVLCYSRMLFFQCYPNFRRFDCKVFLTEALRYFGGAATRTMIDNTHVVVLRGSRRNMVPVPEMAAFGERFGFQFVAHAIGNANRSARVERPFHFIENNFLAGRTFRSWEDLNQRAREWCDKVNSTYKKHIRAVPRELFAVERLHLKPLPML